MADSIIYFATSNVNLEDIPGESWLVIPGTRDCYSASSFGRIKRVGNSPSGSRIIKQYVHPRNGYCYACLSVAGKASQRRVHGLVSASFLGDRPQGKQVNHIDGNKTNNSVGNLEYVTQSENMLHAYRTGLQIPLRGEQTAASILTSEDVAGIIAMEFEATHKAIGVKFGVTRKCVSAILSGRSWSHFTGRKYSERTKKLGRPYGRIRNGS